MTHEIDSESAMAPRRQVLFGGLGGVAAAVAVGLTAGLPETAEAKTHLSSPGALNMEDGFVTLKDGVKIYYKDWGPRDAQVLFFHHGWPLSADDWDNQMMFFLAHGYRVIAHDRRGHGRSTQTSTGNDMDTYCADVAEVVAALQLPKGAIHIGHSTGGGEVCRYTARYGRDGVVKKAVFISAIPPCLGYSEKNPTGVPVAVFEGIRQGTAYNRQTFYQEITLPFYGFNRPGAKVVKEISDNWWRQGMMGGIKAAYDCIEVFQNTQFFDDLPLIDCPVLVMHGEDDQIAPFPITGARAWKMVKDGHLKSYPGFCHGMPATNADVINKDLLEFIRA